MKTQEHKKRSFFLQNFFQPIVIQEGAADNFELDIIDTHKLSKSLFQGHNNNNSKFKKCFKGEFSKIGIHIQLENVYWKEKKYMAVDCLFSKIYCLE